MEMAPQGPVDIRISSLPISTKGMQQYLPPRSEETHFSWVQILTAGWQGKSLPYIPLLGKEVQLSVG